MKDLLLELLMLLLAVIGGMMFIICYCITAPVFSAIQLLCRWKDRR